MNKAKCPICQTAETTGPHCDRAGCTWFKCSNKECDAVLDPAKGIGHAYDPAKVQDKVTKAIRRIRYTLVAKMWVRRDAV